MAFIHVGGKHVVTDNPDDPSDEAGFIAEIKVEPYRIVLIDLVDADRVYLPLHDIGAILGYVRRTMGGNEHKLIYQKNDLTIKVATGLIERIIILYGDHDDRDTARPSTVFLSLSDALAVLEWVSKNVHVPF